VADTTASATKGGILPAILTSDAPSLSAYHSIAVYAVQHSDRAYSKLFTPSVANRARGEQALSTVDPDVISSYEVSPDGLTLTMKLRPEATYDPRPPTSSRKVTTQDVDFSWKIFKAQHKSRGLVSNEVNKNAPVASLTTPDDRTIVMKLAFPSPSLLPNLAFNLNSPFIYPVEADGKYDPNAEMRGSGPWMLEKYTPSAIFQYRRNPNFYNKNRPHLDGIDYPIVQEYATQLAQFRAGKVYSFGIRSEDIVPMKKDFPEMTMVAADFTTALGGMVWFDYRPSKGSIWFDDRVRQALSMTVDRDLFIDTLSNAKRFTDEGIPVDKRWNSHVPGGEAEFWVDPQGKDFGENAKFFKYNLAEAAKLVKAASGKDRLETPWTIVQGNDYGQAYHQQASVLQGMFNEGPFKFNTAPMDYSTGFAQKASAPARLTGGHDFDGAAYGLIPVFPEVDSLFANHYISGGPYYKFEEEYPKDARWDGFMKAQQLEQDPKKRAEIIKDFQRYAAGKMYVLPYPGQANTFSIAWPWVGNFGTFTSRGTNADTYLWLDKSKMKA
jgi:peptide/nickel transport system substrate-binding protein